MREFFEDALTGGLAVTGVWTVLSLSLALLFGRIMHARDTQERPLGVRRPLASRIN